MVFIGKFATPASGEAVLGYQTNLTLWYKADAIVGLNDNDAVGTWADSSGGGFDLTQATAGNKPLYKTGIINGKPVVRFDGSDDYLQNTAFSATTAYAWFIVCRFLAAPGAQKVLMGGIDTYGIGHLWSSSAASYYIFNGVEFYQSSTWTSTDWYYITVRLSNSDGGMWKNGSSVQTGNGTPASLGELIMGARIITGNPDQAANIDVAEMLFYSEDISDANRATVESYLATKYGL